MMRKRIKGLLTVLAVIVLATACFTACASKDDPVAISLSGMKTQFACGEAFSTGDMAVTVEAGDGSTRQAAADEYIVDASSYKADVTGTYTIVVTLKGSDVSRSYSVTVADVVPVSITLDPLKTEFEYGEAFTSEGLAVTVSLSDLSTRRAKSSEIECDASAYRAETAGDYDIVVTLKGYDISETYMVTVKAEVVTSWEDDGALKILTIGNSFSEDAMRYVWQIADSLGVEKIVLGNLYIGGCSLDTHANNAISDAAAYEYQMNTNGDWIKTYGQRMGDVISSQNWDFISLQQASGSSGQASTYSRLDELADYVTSLNDTAKLVWHMTWAYQQDSEHGDFVKYDRSQQKMYDMIVSSVQEKVVKRGDIAAVVPNGTAVQNARTSLIGDALTRDGYHLTLEVGRYIAGLTLVQTLTGLSVDKIAYAPVDAAHKTVAIEAATNACKQPFAVTQSKYADIADTEKEEIPPAEDYDLLTIEWTPFGFYNSTDKTRYDTPITTDGNLSHKFFATQRFTKETLPVGSIILLKTGWKYRPEAWKTDAPQQSRPDNTSVSRVEVTEQWWGDYLYRALNLSKGDGSTLRGQEDAARAALQIYIPKQP